MKLYVWEEFLAGASSTGKAFAVADSVTAAQFLIANKFRDEKGPDYKDFDEWHRMIEDLCKEPKVLDLPNADYEEGAF